MKSVSTILLAIDGEYEDSGLLDEVESIASHNKARVTVLSVMEPPDGDPDKEVAVKNLHEWASKIRSDYVEGLAAKLSKAGIAASVAYSVGKPHLEIIRKTLDGEYDLVVKPAKQETGIQRLLIGGTDIQLMSLCPTPVWVFQPTVSRNLQKIAVAVDLQPNDRERSELARKVLGWGKYLAEAVGADLHVVNVWSLYREAVLRSQSGFSKTVDTLLVDKERMHRLWLDDALRDVGMADSAVQEHIIKGEAKQVIVNMAGKLGIDLLVMGTVGRTGIPGFFIGNTADSVLREIGCSVLAIKPDSFSTPVAPAAKG